ncbi:VasL domain-containing protein [Citrobacter sp. JGM124]|uniref:VasL domain-containing protein n=1 Tax=Citrobacter sp. JGM124 TaxID=2799789 RepID=UPI001BA4976A|nr:VasL domain-containing protein [Citrobacter sp. JGM124]MBS0846769.1 type VI secretion system ImpA family N-terminal domain-containing protein [Citrobacter sp. JGM124]
MHDVQPRPVKTGSDPRTLPDYVALREELSKLTHPARPDVNWHYVEKLCLSLFEQNGVELQTAAWYTQARTQLAGLFGLNEGLAILDALISHQWGALWPQPVHARIEILSSLSQRLQQRLRTLPLNYSDLSQLYRAEQLLTSLGTVLQRLELKHLSQFDALRSMMHNSAIRLENSNGTSDSGGVVPSGIPLPARLINGTGVPVTDDNVVDGGNVSQSTAKWVYVAQPELQSRVEVQTVVPDGVKRWPSFIAGMCTMLVISAVTTWGWQYLHRPDPLQTQLLASLAPLPVPLTSEQLDVLRQHSPLSPAILTQTEQQLTRLDKLPPDWNIDYSQQLLEQAQVLWPEKARLLTQQWRQQRHAAALPAEQLNDWHTGMMILKKLSDRLNGLDEKKGKYMTVSELKSVVFSAMQSFDKSIPAEEQLRILAQTPAGEALPAAARAQLEMHLQQLTARYAEIKQPASK